MTWTPQSVRDLLPNVRAKVGRKTITARISGRKNRFATVSVTNEGTLHRNSILWLDREFSWETIADCLNHNKPLIMG